MKEFSDELKILFFDIESAPNIGYTWGQFEQNVVEFLSEKYILCFSYMWGHEQKIRCLWGKNERKLVKELWKLFNAADVVVAHNGDSFDIKFVNTRFLYYGLTPPSPYDSIDTKKVVCNVFNFNSNSLDNVADFLGFGRKIKVDFKVWKGCMANQRKAWAVMTRYNKRDVELLFRVYLRVRPYINSHPAVAVDKCGHCSSDRLVKRGVVRSKAGLPYQRVVCKDCGAWSQTKIKVKRKAA